MRIDALFEGVRVPKPVRVAHSGLRNLYVLPRSAQTYIENCLPGDSIFECQRVLGLSFILLSDLPDLFFRELAGPHF